MNRAKNNRYTTIARTATWEVIIKRSRFIGIATAIITEQDANDFLDSVRAEYPEANHYVYAWRTNEPHLLQKYSDDGEPQGTGGLPVLDVLEKSGVDRGAICVVRYFGGVLLGSGGLLRAYSEAASEALTLAGLQDYSRCQIFTVEIDYSLYDILCSRLDSAGFYYSDPQFTSKVKLTIGSYDERVNELKALIRDLTSGQANLMAEGERFMPSPT